MAAFATAHQARSVAPLEDFRWEELVDDMRFQSAPGFVSLGAEQTSRSVFAVTQVSAEALADGAAFREWLLSGGFSTVELPLFPAPTFEGYRELAMAILATLPDTKLIFPAAEDHSGLAKAARMWGGALEDTAPTLNTETSPLAAEMTACLDTMEAPEDPQRIEERLAHIRRNALQRSSMGHIEDAKGHSSQADILRLGAIAANAIIPGFAARFGDGISFGRGYVLRHWQGRGLAREELVSDVLGFHLARTGHEDTPCNGAGHEPAGEVPFDPSRGAILKHEPVHGLFVTDGQVRVAMGALRVAGHGEKHLYITCEDGALPETTIFCFNESWQFVGMSVDRFAPTAGHKAALAVLTPLAIWDDLVARADLGCGKAADALNDLAKTKRGAFSATSKRGQQRLSLA